MSTRLERDVRFLKGYALISTAVIAIIALAAFRSQQKTTFNEIDVQRINVIEPNGMLRMVLSNAAKSQGPLYQGKPFFYTGAERPRTGIIFFNDEGTETGGLIFGGRQLGDTGFTGLGHLSFDQFNQDQVFVIQYVDRNGKRRMGIQVNDRHNTNIFDWANTRDSIRRLPDSPAKTAALQRMQDGEPGDPRVAERVYVGRDTLKRAVVNLSDKFGKHRLRLIVDSLGTPRIEFLEERGAVTHRIP
jgi:hypothetical protein